jgi:hypothetical protein
MLAACTSVSNTEMAVWSAAYVASAERGRIGFPRSALDLKLSAYAGADWSLVWTIRQTSTGAVTGAMTSCGGPGSGGTSGALYLSDRRLPET